VKARLRSFVFSFQTKLVMAMMGVILLAVLLAGAVFVARTRHERRQQALDRVAAASPAIYQQAFYALVEQSETDQSFSDALDQLAKEQDVRIIVVDNTDTVFHDTGGTLDGAVIPVPASNGDDLQRGFVAWEPGESFPERDLTLVTASGRIVTGNGRPLPFRIILAVKTDTLASAWVGVLPGLGLASLIALPLALIAALLLARQVAQPVRKLTAASEAMARGDFDQRVEVSRDDEVGRLARSFTVMAEHVGERESQMRALLANVSHDLKTPMTSITGYAQALKDGTAEPEDVSHIAEVITEEADHVNTLLADLLYLGEIDAGQVVAHREDTALEPLISRCVRRIEPRARAKGIDVTVDLPPDSTLRNVDPDKLERAFTNVLDNAAKFTPQGGEITVRGWRANGATPPRLICDVTNSGENIAPDDLPRVFDRFFRGDRARQTASGSGLGLAITRQLVELNGGTIDAENTPGGGVTFRFSLPA
jgi:signal transduction histidine kinase